MVTTEVPRRCELDPSAELLCGKLLLMQRLPTSSFVWKVYVVNFDIGEIMKKAKARKLVGKSYMSKVLYKKALPVYKVPRAKKKSVVRSEKSVTMDFGDGSRGIALSAQAKLLEHVASTAFGPHAGGVPPVWVEAAVVRWVFDFQHRLPCFGTLSSTWAEMRQLRGRNSKSDQSGDELCLCVKVLQLLFHQYGTRVPRRNLATDPPETGADICTSADVTKDGLKRTVIKARRKSS